MVDFICKLIEFKPVNHVGEGRSEELAVQNWIREHLKTSGFSNIDYWTADSEEKRPNIVTTLKGSEHDKSLIYNGHVDVVPVYDNQLPRWTVDPWTPTIKNGMIYGRGACDMFGGVTSMIWAAKALLENNSKLKGNLYVECVSGEESNEGGSLGTNSTIERGYDAPFAIITEPTNCEIHTNTCGTFIFEMTIPGKEIHTSMRNLTIFPQRYGIQHGSDVGVDAIDKAVKYLNAFRELERNWNFRWKHPVLGGGGYPTSTDYQGVGIFSFTPTLIEGGTYIASLPGYCRITFQIYYPSWLTANEVWDEVKNVTESVSANDDWLKTHPPTLKIDKSMEGDLDYIPIWDPNEVPVNHEGCQTLASAWKKVTGEEAIFSGFKATCDATYFGKRNIPAIVFGPGDLSMGAHGPDERVSIDDVIKCCKTCAAMAVQWCS